MQAIPIFVINLDRRPDRMDRIADHLRARGVDWYRSSATDAQRVTPEELDQIVRRTGPLGRLGDGDRACSSSHMSAWRMFLDTTADFALFLEDDAYLAEDTAQLLASADWVPDGVDVIKLEKFGDRISNVLLSTSPTPLPNGRALHAMYSRHVGGAAYILSRRAALAGLAASGEMRVPVDHLWFNPNVSSLARQFRPHLIRPGMATQRAWGYNSDIAGLGKKAAPKGWARRWMSLKRGLYELRLVPAQLMRMALGQARFMSLAWQEAPPDDRAE